MRSHSPRAALAVLPLMLAASAGAGAFEFPTPSAAADGVDNAFLVPAEGPAAEAPAPVDAPGFGPAVAEGRLAAMRGGDGNVNNVSNRANLRGNVNGNSATNVISGGNLVSDSSFGNAAGISTVIQNSGSNVLIQNSTIVNVQFLDPMP
ncbi:MAG: hypothetical protein ACOY37_00800 [Pseudomonadota bacterium]